MDKKTIIELIKRNILRMGTKVSDNVIACSGSNNSSSNSETCMFYNKETDIIDVMYSLCGDKMLLKIDNLGEISITSYYKNNDDEIMCAISGKFSSTTGTFIETRNYAQSSQMRDILYKIMQIGLLSFEHILISHLGIVLSDIGIDVERIQHRTNEIE